MPVVSGLQLIPLAIPPALRVRGPQLDRQRLERAVQAYGRGARIAQG
jgi:hypothetical protein